MMRSQNRIPFPSAIGLQLGLVGGGSSNAIRVGDTEKTQKANEGMPAALIPHSVGDVFFWTTLGLLSGRRQAFRIFPLFSD
jgi:hypothetical protein